TDTYGESYRQEITLTIPGGEGASEPGDDGNENLEEEDTGGLDEEVG
nr:hypothetical protein [Candidatus Dadabacteria bacterium]